MRMPRSLAVSLSGTRLPFATISQLCPVVGDLELEADGARGGARNGWAGKRKGTQGQR
jgi:hypothetical protein